MSFETRVVVKNAKQTMAALQEFDPEAAKVLKKEISDAAGTVVKSARAMMPTGPALTNWGSWSHGGRDLSYDSNGRKIRTTRASMRKRGTAISNYIGITNPTPAGAIFELVGRRNPQPSFLTAFLKSDYGVSVKNNTQRPGVFKAFDEDKGAAVKRITQALQQAETKLQQVLNAIGE